MSNGQVIQHPHWPPGHGPNRPVHPGPAPIHPPWWGHPHPDWCDCGCDPCVCQPCPPNWSQDAIRCWNEMQQFRNMVAEIVQCELAKLPPGITGITDGSDAKPGEVGEFVRGTATVNYAAYPAVTTTMVSPLVVPPGDWDLFGVVTISTGVGQVTAYITPQPAGMSDIIHVQEGATGTGGVVSAPQQAMNTVRGNFTVPTLINFSITVDQSYVASLQAGVATVICCARRQR